MITTDHKLLIGDARNLNLIKNESIDLVVTSPPYPMIEMWDRVFILQNPRIKTLLKNLDGSGAFELMHRELDKAWNEVFRVLKPGGIACINIGDATRTVNGLFQMFTNHSRILQYFTHKGCVALPGILWRKQTNAPNKFMGSGMLPPGAYVTLEHEFILILRKGGKKEFNTSYQKQQRRESAFFWEERNLWFSDVWEDLKGKNQRFNHGRQRERSGAYPFELAHRLINMFSVKGDTVLDPFVGTGTTMLAAMCNGRNSIGLEIDGSFEEIITSQCENIVHFSNEIIRKRLENHLDFITKRTENGKETKYKNEYYGFPVITRQEVKLKLNLLENIQKNGNLGYTVFYKEGTAGDIATFWP